jgi:tetratricopeptide (TPR) repeat protein
MRQGDYQAHRAHLDEGVAIARQVGDTRLLVSMLVNLGFGARVHEDYAAARLALAEGLALARQEGGTFDTATALHHLGLLALEADRDLEAAWTLSEQSLALYRQIGSRRQVAVVLESMGRVARARGQLLEARRLLVEGLSALWTIGDLGPLPQTLYALAAVDADSGQIERAVQLQVAAMEMEVTVGAQVWPVHRREHDGWWGMAATTLGGARLSWACAEGRAMSVEQVVAYALEKSGSFDAP